MRISIANLFGLISSINPYSEFFDPIEVLFVSGIGLTFLLPVIVIVAKARGMLKLPWRICIAVAVVLILASIGISSLALNIGANSG